MFFWKNAGIMQVMSNVLWYLASATVRDAHRSLWRHAFAPRKIATVLSSNAAKLPFR